MKLRKMTAAAMSAILALLGYSCSTDDPTNDDLGGLVMYGSPTADYHVQGKVMNKQGEPLPSIQVVAAASVKDNNMNGDLEWPLDTVYTDKQGEFVMDIGCQGVLRFTDVDGEENGGEFKTNTQMLKDYPNKQTKPEKGWYFGAFEYIANQILYLKQKE